MSRIAIIIMLLLACSSCSQDRAVVERVTADGSVRIVDQVEPFPWWIVVPIALCLYLVMRGTSETTVRSEFSAKLDEAEHTARTIARPAVTVRKMSETKKANFCPRCGRKDC